MLVKLNIFFILFFGSMACAFEPLNALHIVEDMQKQLGDLDENRTFSFVDLGLAKQDLELINGFKVESSAQYNCFGNLGLLQDELPVFLRRIGTNDEQLIQKITQIIFEVASRVRLASDKETAWVCVRASTSSPMFDMSRWHWDGYYYFPYSGFAFKFAMVLKGNPTLFCQVTNDLRKTVQIHFNDREFLSNLLDKSFIESPHMGQGAFFIVGDKNSAAVHSEPKMDGERLFLSVLPGNENEISELKARWNS
jgi:hypothetical protein